MGTSRAQTMVWKSAKSFMPVGCRVGLARSYSQKIVAWAAAVLPGS